MIHNSEVFRNREMNYEFRSVNHRRYDVLRTSQALIEFPPKQFLPWLRIGVYRRILLFGAMLRSRLCLGNCHFCEIRALEGGEISPQIRGKKTHKPYFCGKRINLGAFNLQSFWNCKCRGGNAAQKPAIIDARDGIAIFHLILSKAWHHPKRKYRLIVARWFKTSF